MPSSVDEIFAGLRGAGKATGSFDEVIASLSGLKASSDLDMGSVGNLINKVEFLKGANIKPNSVENYLLSLKRTGKDAELLERVDILKNIDEYKNIFKNNDNFLKQLGLPADTLDDAATGATAAAKSSDNVADATRKLGDALGDPVAAEEIASNLNKLSPESAQTAALDAMEMFVEKADVQTAALTKKLDKMTKNFDDLASGAKKADDFSTAVKMDLWKLGILAAKFGAGYYLLWEIEKLMKKDQETERKRVKCRAICEPLFWEKAEAAGLGGTTELGDSSLGYRVLDDPQEGDEIIDKLIYEDSWDWDTQPLCPKDPPANCKTYCRDECDEEHPKENPFSWLGGGLADVSNEFTDSLLDSLGLGDLGETATKAVKYTMLGFVILVALIFAVFAIRAVIGKKK